MLAVDMRNVSKRFAGVLANDKINFELEQGQIHCLLGENGAGKTTLMSILYGLYQPDDGEVYVRGARVRFKSPRDAMEAGIGMVHQHFTLVPTLSVAENIVLGLKSVKFLLDTGDIERRIGQLSKKYELEIEPRAKVWQLSVGEQQRVEILSTLYRGAEILVLDEPTSTLTPQETKGLFATLRGVADEGRSVVFITHKLNEAMATSDRITVLRDGKVVSKVRTKETSDTELARMMVGRDVLFQLMNNPGRESKGDTVLQVKEARTVGIGGMEALRGLSLTIHGGEIVGIAGVAGNGQTELAEVVTGIRKVTEGHILLKGKDLTNGSPREFIDEAVAHIPEDRLDGLVLDFTINDNCILGRQWVPPISKKGILNRVAIIHVAQKMTEEFNVKTPSLETPAKNLSGGNLQKMILARELSKNPILIVAVHPTRGLDVGATEYIHRRLLEARDRGAAVLLISTDLEEIMLLSDTIAVMYEGDIVGFVSPKATNIEELGLMMAGRKRLTPIAKAV